MKVLSKYLSIAAILGTVTVLSAAPDSTVPVSGSDAPKPASTLSAAEMQVNASSMDTQMKDDLRHVLHLQDVAKKQKDVIKVNCVNDKLIQLKAQMNIADTSNQQLQIALVSNTGARQPLYAALVDHSTEIKRLREEANACAGEPELRNNEADIEVHHPDFPDDPTTENPFDVGSEVEPPGYASPFH